MKNGVYVPLVTPFVDGDLDLASFEKLCDHVMERGPAGIVLFGTTAESLLLTDQEKSELTRIVTSRLPEDMELVLALTGVSYSEMIRQYEHLSALANAAYLVSCPFYVRPSQLGLIDHFDRMSKEIWEKILVYNIPFRSAIAVENDTLLELSDLPNIVGVKDVCGDYDQSFDFLMRKPEHFKVFAGQDPHLFPNLCHGAEASILASAHFETDRFIAMSKELLEGNTAVGRNIWKELWPFLNALFVEPSPIGIKYYLWKMGIITSPECRSPLSRCEPANAKRLDSFIGKIS